MCLPYVLPMFLLTGAPPLQSPSADCATNRNLYMEYSFGDSPLFLCSVRRGSALCAPAFGRIQDPSVCGARRMSSAINRLRPPPTAAPAAPLLHLPLAAQRLAPLRVLSKVFDKVEFRTAFPEEGCAFIFRWQTAPPQSSDPHWESRSGTQSSPLPPPPPFS